MQVAFGTRFIFSVDTALFDEVALQSPQRWSSHDRLGQRPALQNLGPGTETATLPGVIFECFFGDSGSLETLYQIKEAGEPQELWTIRNARGELYLPGRWVITDIAETWTDLGGGGKPRQRQWVLNLSRYD